MSKKETKKKVAVLTPTRDGLVDSSYVSSLVETVKLLSDKYDISPSIVTGVSDIALGRTKLWSAWYKNKDVDYCLWLDSDIGVNPKDYARLFECIDKYDLDAIAVSYPKKAYDPRALLRSAHILQQNEGQIDVGISVEASYTYVSTGLHKLINEGELKGLMTCDGVGFGCVLIGRKGADKLMKWAEKNMDKTEIEHIFKENETIKGYHIFDSVMNEENEVLSEDYSFFERWKMAGNSLYILPDVKVRHTGFSHYDGNFQSFVKVMGYLDAESEPLNKDYRK